MRCKSFLLLALLLGVTLFHVNKVVCDDEETEEEVEDDDEGKTGRPRAPKTCIDEREAWMCPKGGEEDEEELAEEENGVLVLTKDNFDTIVNDADIILVEFYAPWCGHCKSLAPEYEKAAQRMKENEPPVPFAKVDATVESELGQRYEVSGYPTMKIFRKGEAFDYKGPRKENGIVKFMQEQADPNWEPPPSDVIVLTNENFDEIVNPAELILVEFYAPWCGHCKKLAPEYEEAASALKTNDPPIKLAKVDATEQKELGDKFGVTGYPTLKMFRKGKEYEYKGPREAQGIINYMSQQSGDSSMHLDTLKKIKNFLDYTDDISVVGFFNIEDDELYSTYQNTGNSLRDEYRFAHTFDAKARDIYKVNAPSVVIFTPERFHSKYEPKKHVFTMNDATSTDLTEFYQNNDTPLVGQMTPANKDRRFQGRPLLVAYYDVDWSFDHRVQTEIWRQKIVEVAKDDKYQDLQFAIATEEGFKDDMKTLQLDDSGEEINIGLWDADGKRYRMEPDEDFDSDVLRDFLSAWRKNKLKPVIKSQAAPKKNKGPVTIVVAKTFEDIVLDDSKDVLIELYAPWCGHCKKLEPAYKKLGKKYKDNKNIVIAKMDATANDPHPDFSHSGFPTIYFAPAGDKKNPITFEGGDRSLEKLSEFIEEHATTLKKDEL